MDEWFEKDRERAMAELRIARIEHQLAVAHIDWLGGLLRDGMIQPWGARAAVAEIYEGGPDAQDQ